MAPVFRARALFSSDCVAVAKTPDKKGLEGGRLISSHRSRGSDRGGPLHGSGPTARQDIMVKGVEEGPHPVTAARKQTERAVPTGDKVYTRRYAPGHPCLPTATASLHSDY